MADAIAYCGQCGKMVAPVEIRTGQAVVSSTVAMCAACVALLTAEQRAALMKMADVQVAGPAPAGPGGTKTKSSGTTGRVRASTRRRSGRLAQVQVDEEAPAQGKSRAGMAIMIGFVVLLFVGVFAFMLRPEDEEKKQALPAVVDAPPPPSLTKTPPLAPPPLAQPAVTRPAAADPAAREKRLDEIRWLISPSMDKYFEIQEKLDAFQADYPGDAEASALREPVDRKFGEVADKELADAVEFATELAAKGDKDRAARHMRSIDSRFGGSKWYRTKGRKAVEDALAKIGVAEVAARTTPAPERPARAVEARPASLGRGGGGVKGDLIWIEGESSRQHNFTKHSWYDRVKKELLSGSDWLSHWDGRASAEATYEFEAAGGGEYTFWMRLNPYKAKMSYQLDGGGWVDIDTGNARDRVMLSEKIDVRFIAWTLVGKVLLSRGGHTIKVRVAGEAENSGGIDCFTFTKDTSYVPSGVAKPEATEIVPEELPSGAEDIRASRAAIKARDFEKARNLLARRDEWRDSDRSSADALITIIDDAETRATEVERALGDPWTRFLIGFSEAGKKGLPRAREYLKSERGSLRAADLGDGAARMKKVLRDADLVHDLVKEELLSSKRPIRFVTGQKRISGRVQSIEDGVIRLKTTIGKAVEIKLTDCLPSDLVEKARLVRLGAVTNLQLASYYFALGDMAAAGKLADELSGVGAPALREDIGKLASLAAKTAAGIELPELVEVEESEQPAEADPVSRSLARGLVGYWKLDDEGETVRDYSGKGADGTRHGGAWASGRFGGAFRSIDSGYIELPRSSDLDTFMLGDHSITFWLKILADPPGKEAFLVGKTGRHKGIMMTQARELRFIHWSEGGFDPGTIWGGRVMERDTWYHVVSVLDLSGGATRLYVDGAIYRDRNWGKKAVPSRKQSDLTCKIGIGIPAGGGDTWAAGDCLFDEVRFYDRALSGGDVAALADPERARRLAAGSRTDALLGGLSKGLVAHWTLDGNADDSSGKGNDGVKKGGGWAGGKFGEAFKGRGWENHVKVPDSDDFKVQRITISVWLKLDKALKDMGAGTPAVVSMSSWQEKKGFFFGNMETRVDKLCFTVYSGGTHHKVFMDDTEPGKWVHVAASYDGSRLRVYSDGKEVRSKEIGSVKIDYDKRDLVIGDGFEGLIDDVRIYDRVLSEAEVAALVDRELAARVALASAKGTRMMEKVEAPPEGWPKEPLPGETGRPGEWASGLIAEIFSGRDFKTRVGVRIDPAIDYSFGEAGPGLGLPVDDFAIRWTGWLLLPHEGVYSFEASADDAIKVYLHGKLLVDSSSSKRSSPRRFLAGLHPIVAEFKESTQGASAQFKWSGKDFVLKGGGGVIPPEYFYHEVPTPGEYGPPAKLMRGLWAEYYRDEQFRIKVAEGPIETFDFDIGNLAPHPLCPDVKFGIRMRGYVLITKSKEYTISVRDIDDDGAVRVYIGGRLVLDSFEARGEKVTEKMKLECGYQEFVCEYVGGGSDSKLFLSWAGGWPKRGGHDGAIFQEVRPLAKALRKGMAPGMRTVFFAGPKPRGRPIIRTYAPSADIAWKTGKPAPNVPKDRYSAAWQGVLLVPRSGKYLFRADVKGSVLVTVGSRKVLMRGGDTANQAALEGTARLRAGPVPITVTYTETNSDPGMSVWWAGPTFGFRRLRGGALAHMARKLDIAEALPEEEAKPKEVAVVQTVVRRADGRITLVRKTVEKKPEKKEPLPVGNVVGNGGFEVMGPEDFPLGWTKHNWSKSGNFSVRKDKTNTHDDSNYALRVRPVGKSGKPGAFTKVTLPPGRYEVRFWASADLDETAKVHVRLGERELHWAMATEDWDQFKHTFEVTEKQSGATLGLYTTTSVVVWFDDVELSATKDQE